MESPSLTPAFRGKVHKQSGMFVTVRREMFSFSHTHTQTHTQTHTHTHTVMHTHTHTRMHAHTHTHTHTRSCTHPKKGTYTCRQTQTQFVVNKKDSVVSV